MLRRDLNNVILMIEAWETSTFIVVVTVLFLITLFFFEIFIHVHVYMKT